MELLVGLTGMACILLAFTLNVFKRLDSHDKRFLLLNLAGSVLLLWYATILASWPFMILNAVWVVIVLWGLTHHEPRMRKVR